MSGHIYIATNAGLRGICVKSRFTTQSPANALSAQFSTGAPHPFVLLRTRC